MMVKSDFPAFVINIMNGAIANALVALDALRHIGAIKMRIDGRPQPLNADDPSHKIVDEARRQKMLMPPQHASDENAAQLAIVVQNFFDESIVEAKVDIIGHHKVIIAQNTTVIPPQAPEDATARNVVEGQGLTRCLEDEIIDVCRQDELFDVAPEKTRFVESVNGIAKTDIIVLAQIDGGRIDIDFDDLCLMAFNTKIVR